MQRALSFGTVAAAYERHRPGYPSSVVDAVLAYAGRPVRTALEIGAGTGKATRLFAARGIAVTATEPDPAMLAELRTHVPDSVRAVRAAFEELPFGPQYDLVYAAAALHWTDPSDRPARLAARLADSGVFASFGGPLHLADKVLAEAEASARSVLLPDDSVPSPDGTPHDAQLQWPGTELIASPLFTDVCQSSFERRLTLARADYLAHLSTVSAYAQLTERDRTEVLDRIAAVLPPMVTLAADLTLHLARKA